jgi:rare lipoprotein A
VKLPAYRILPLFLIVFLVSCGHSKQAQVSVPPPPPPAESSTAESSTPRPEGATKNDHLPNPEKESDLAEPAIPADAKPIETETGLASWYGPPYHNRVGSNGEVYNMHAMTAAHRTLPLGSIVRVTNLKTGHTALVRITDRGPFIPGRILDLSLAAAHKLDVYGPGSLATGGKWAVQIGGFAHEHEARKIADHLQRRYQTAKVLCFASPAGDWWVRVHVLDDDRSRAQQLTAETQTPEGAVFLVRLN